MMADRPHTANEDGASAGDAWAARRLPVGARHKPLRQAVLDELRSRIVTGAYPPGVRLLEEEVATDLDVSRNPVREALQMLAMEGFVEIEPRRGARVTIFTTERAERIFEVRQPLEGLVARLAATRRSRPQLAALQAVVEEGLATAEAHRLGELPELNTRFHRLLADAADNEFLDDIMSRLSHLIEWVYAARIRERSARSWHEHRLIVDAVTIGDPDEAERCAFSHITNARAAYRFVQQPLGD